MHKNERRVKIIKLKENIETFILFTIYCCVNYWQLIIVSAIILFFGLLFVLN